MNAITHRAFFGDAEHDFTLDPPMIRELEALTSAGTGAVLDRLISREFRFDDLVAVIRLGLIGAGMEPEKAARLVKTYVEGRPVMPSYALAIDILNVLWFGKGEQHQPEIEHQPEALPERPVETQPDIAPIGSEATP